MNGGVGGGICVYVRVSDTGVHCAHKASEPLSLFRTQLEVQCPPGVTIGFVAEHWNLCRASYSIQNEKKESMMRVRGPCATYGCGSDSVFEVNICQNWGFCSPHFCILHQTLPCSSVDFHVSQSGTKKKELLMSWHQPFARGSSWLLDIFQNVSGVAFLEPFYPHLEHENFWE